MLTALSGHGLICLCNLVTVPLVILYIELRARLFFLIIHARVRVRVKRWLSVFRGRLQWEIDYQPLVKQAFAACNNVTLPSRTPGLRGQSRDRQSIEAARDHDTPNQGSKRQNLHRKICGPGSHDFEGTGG